MIPVEIRSSAETQMSAQAQSKGRSTGGTAPEDDKRQEDTKFAKGMDRTIGSNRGSKDEESSRTEQLDVTRNTNARGDFGSDATNNLSYDSIYPQDQRRDQIAGANYVRPAARGADDLRTLHHGDKLQAVADEMKCIIMIRDPNVMGQTLMAEGHATKSSHIKAKSSENGVTAGFVAVEPRYTKLSQPEGKQAAAIKQSLAAGCRKQQIYLSLKRVQELIRHNHVTHSTGPDAFTDKYGPEQAVECKRIVVTSTYPQRGEVKFELRYDARKKAFAVYEIGIKGLERRNPEPVMGLTNPLKYGAVPGRFDAVCADYDLFSVHDHADARIGDDQKVRPIEVRPRPFSNFTPAERESDKTLHDQTYAIPKEEHPEWLNVNKMLGNVITAINIKVAESGTAQIVCHHSDEVGNPNSDSPGFPLFAIYPKEQASHFKETFPRNADGQAVRISNWADLLTFNDQSKRAGFNVPAMNPRWAVPRDGEWESRIDESRDAALLIAKSAAKVVGKTTPGSLERFEMVRKAVEEVQRNVSECLIIKKPNAIVLTEAENRGKKTYDQHNPDKRFENLMLKRPTGSYDPKEPRAKKLLNEIYNTIPKIRQLNHEQRGDLDKYINKLGEAHSLANELITISNTLKSIFEAIKGLQADADPEKPFAKQLAPVFRDTLGNIVALLLEKSDKMVSNDPAQRMEPMIRAKKIVNEMSLHSSNLRLVMRDNEEEVTSLLKDGYNMTSEKHVDGLVESIVRNLFKDMWKSNKSEAEMQANTALDLTETLVRPRKDTRVTKVGIRDASELLLKKERLDKINELQIILKQFNKNVDGVFDINGLPVSAAKAHIFLKMVSEIRNTLTDAARLENRSSKPVIQEKAKWNAIAAVDAVTALLQDQANPTSHGRVDDSPQSLPESPILPVGLSVDRLNMLDKLNDSLASFGFAVPEGVFDETGRPVSVRDAHNFLTEVEQLKSLVVGKARATVSLDRLANAGQARMQRHIKETDNLPKANTLLNALGVIGKGRMESTSDIVKGVMTRDKMRYRLVEAQKIAETDPRAMPFDLRKVDFKVQDDAALKACWAKLVAHVARSIQEETLLGVTAHKDTIEEKPTWVGRMLGRKQEELAEAKIAENKEIVLIKGLEKAFGRISSKVGLKGPLSAKHVGVLLDPSEASEKDRVAAGKALKNLDGKRTILGNIKRSVKSVYATSIKPVDGEARVRGYLPNAGVGVNAGFNVNNSRAISAENPEQILRFGGMIEGVVGGSAFIASDASKVAKSYKKFTPTGLQRQARAVEDQKALGEDLVARFKEKTGPEDRIRSAVLLHLGNKIQGKADPTAAKLCEGHSAFAMQAIGALASVGSNGIMIARSGMNTAGAWAGVAAPTVVGVAVGGFSSLLTATVSSAVATGKMAHQAVRAGKFEKQNNDALAKANSARLVKAHQAGNNEANPEAADGVKLPAAVDIAHHRLGKLNRPGRYWGETADLGFQTGAWGSSYGALTALTVGGAAAATVPMIAGAMVGGMTAYYMATLAFRAGLQASRDKTRDAITDYLKGVADPKQIARLNSKCGIDINGGRTESELKSDVVREVLKREPELITDILLTALRKEVSALDSKGMDRVVALRIPLDEEKAKPEADRNAAIVVQNEDQLETLAWDRLKISPTAAYLMGLGADPEHLVAIADSYQTKEMDALSRELLNFTINRIARLDGDMKGGNYKTTG